MAPIKVDVPTAPAFLPPKLQDEWAKTYADRFNEAKENGASDNAAHQTARGEANRVLKVKAPTSYEEAKALPKWQIHGELVEKDGVLKGVTIDGKKFRFPVPAKKGAGAADQGAKTGEQK